MPPPKPGTTSFLFSLKEKPHAPVSYTHLDVYKRQLHIYAKYRPKYWIQIAPDSYLTDNNGETYQLRSGIGIIPVSYTHLDVYKRQVVT